MASSNSVSSLLMAAILLSLLQLTLTYRNINGDGLVLLYKDTVLKRQLNIYLGDQFIVQFETEYDDISHLKITQSVNNTPSGKVTVVFDRVEDHLFEVTSIWPVNVACGGNAIPLSGSDNWPNRYVTDLSIRNSRNETLSSRKVRKIMLDSHRTATNPGILVVIIPTTS